MGYGESIPSFHTGPQETPRTLDLLLLWTQKQSTPHLKGCLGEEGIYFCLTGDSDQGLRWG